MLTCFASEPERATVERLPDRTLLVALNDNIRRVDDAVGPEGESSEQWEADRYTLVIPALPGIEKSVEANFDEWLRKAKDAPVPEATDRERLNDLEAAMIEIASIVGGE